MNRDLYTPVKLNESHSHQYVHVAGFGAQDHHKSMIEEHHKTMDILRKEFYSTDDSPYKRICYRDCFKQPIKRHVEFCLEKRCQGASLSEAAKFMGYAK